MEKRESQSSLKKRRHSRSTPKKKADQISSPLIMEEKKQETVMSDVVKKIKNDLGIVEAYITIPAIYLKRIIG